MFSANGRDVEFLGLPEAYVKLARQVPVDLRAFSLKGRVPIVQQEFAHVEEVKTEIENLLIALEGAASLGAKTNRISENPLPVIVQRGFPIILLRHIRSPPQQVCRAGRVPAALVMGPRSSSSQHCLSLHFAGDVPRRLVQMDSACFVERAGVRRNTRTDEGGASFNAGQLLTIRKQTCCARDQDIDVGA